MVGEDRLWMGEIGGAGEEKDDAIESGGKRGELILSHPSRGKRGEGDQKRRWRFDQRTAAVTRRVAWKRLSEIGPAGTLNSSNHDGDDDGEDAEGFEAAFRHG